MKISPRLYHILYGIFVPDYLFFYEISSIATVHYFAESLNLLPLPSIYIFYTEFSKIPKTQNGYSIMASSYRAMRHYASYLFTMFLLIIAQCIYCMPICVSACLCKSCTYSMITCKLCCCAHTSHIHKRPKPR